MKVIEDNEEDQVTLSSRRKLKVIETDEEHQVTLSSR